MLPSGHLAAGYLVTTALLEIVNAHLTADQNSIVLFCGTISGALPDIDLAYYFFRGKIGKLNPNENHRLYITHAPILWLLLSAFFYALATTNFGRMLAASLFLGTWSHFALDSIEYGVPWLWPFYLERIAFKKEIINYHDTKAKFFKAHFYFATKTYPKMITFWIEVVIIIAALVLFFSTNTHLLSYLLIK